MFLKFVAEKAVICQAENCPPVCLCWVWGKGRFVLRVTGVKGHGLLGRWGERLFVKVTFCLVLDRGERLCVAWWGERSFVKSVAWCLVRVKCHGSHRSQIHLQH